ncbi:hypothetical protein [Nocardia farcinica]|uniref:hypothetical protein n=1 Tax=Nocardia farcinica TaxID=37329 RepID=UPI001895F156|nr:hypothetical protein [Nocardia farcinica]MBF6185075.1 hypothetical protein [Nocardia farcinica]
MSLRPDMTPAQASDFIRATSPKVVQSINDFAAQTFVTRGGRLGSGMGLLLEGLWAYHTSAQLVEHGIEIAWIADNQYNDYACVDLSSDWDPTTMEGELFRIEAKTMNLGADESKAHFAELQKNIGKDDLLLVMTWAWQPDRTGRRMYPRIVDTFIERALPLAEFRDDLHKARGGTFVSRWDCPDGCEPELCQHDGEPLNASGKRERLSGPESCRPSARVSFAANFGGLFRMIGTKGKQSKDVLEAACRQNEIANRYVSFVRRSKKSSGISASIGSALF